MMMCGTAGTDGTVFKVLLVTVDIYLIPDVRGKTFNPFTIEYGVSFVPSLMPFVSLKYSASLTQFVKSFYDEQMFEFYQMYFTHLLR